MRLTYKLFESNTAINGEDDARADHAGSHPCVELHTRTEGEVDFARALRTILSVDFVKCNYVTYGPNALSNSECFDILFKKMPLKIRAGGNSTWLSR